MKTPREILLERHRSAEGQLDRIRRTLVAQRPMSLGARLVRELLFPLRWHVAGISAVWLIVAVLNVDHASRPVISAGSGDSSPRQLIVVLAENRRQLAEMIEPATSEAAPAPNRLIPRRRSDTPPTTAVV